MKDMKEWTAQKLKIGATQKKILLLLIGGIALGFTKNPYRAQKIAQKMGKEWNKINQQTLATAIKKLYQNQLIKYHEKENGEIMLILSKTGKYKALTYTIETMKIKKPARWDNKWRIVVFDIPEHTRKMRDALRDHLRRLEFYELQKSVFIYPYACEDEIEFLIEVYGARQYVRQMEVIKIDNESHLKKIFYL